MALRELPVLTGAPRLQLNLPWVFHLPRLRLAPAYLPRF